MLVAKRYYLRKNCQRVSSAYIAFQIFGRETRPKSTGLPQRAVEFLLSYRIYVWWWAESELPCMRLE